ncbi:hypothetical protein BDV98DRAFT_598670 [Pterulicium gracile]|uniref:FAD dependent oxidoreductase domain-containing protein n=1 Tax=Pterulicium gracile TaxID=1884261 RepID=A0A5C3Q0L8_9AGAR|nr:hypothetical protein BDV98DRAFT_598670 [Pterula gracilis]
MIYAQPETLNNTSRFVSLDVAIIGGGIGGLSSAIALGRARHRGASRNARLGNGSHLE